MWYLIMALLGAAVGWYMSKYGGAKSSLTMCIVIGVIGGLIGGLIGTLLSFAAVILFKLALAIAGAFFLIYFVQQYQAKK